MKRLWVSGSLLGMFAGVASAQGTAQFNITYQAVGVTVTPAPTTILLVGIGLLLTFVAYRKTRRLPLGRSMVAILFAAGLAFVTLNKASANVPTQSLTGPGPLQFSVTNGQEMRVLNNTGVSQQITGITLNPNPGSLAIVTPPDGPQCIVGFTLANGAQCFVEAQLIVSTRPAR
jgi:hypothetical protein